MKGRRRWKPASPLAGLPSWLWLLAAAGPTLLLLKELFGVGGGESRRGDTGKRRQGDEGGYDLLHGFLFLTVFRHCSCRQDAKRRNWPGPLDISRTCERT